MSDLLSRHSGGELLGLISVVVGCLTGAIIAVTAIITGNWSATRRAELETGLKQQLVSRGMSAEEIAKVVKATSAESADSVC